MWVENSESLYRRLRGLRLYRIKCTSETKLSASYFSSFTARLPYGRLLAATMSAAEMLTAKWPGAAPRVHTGLGGPFLGPPAGADPGGGLLSAPPPVTVVRAGDTSDANPGPACQQQHLVKVRTCVFVIVKRLTSEVLVRLMFCSWAASLGRFLALIFISSRLSPPHHLSCHYIQCSRVCKTSGQTRA